MSQTRPSVLISAVGTIHVLIGLVYVAVGAYILTDGASAVATLFQLKKEVSEVVGQVPVPKENAQQIGAAANVAAKGLGGLILALAGVVAGCSFLHGLPLLLVGVGVLLRSRAARVFALVFALFALLEGIACVANTGQSNRFLILGLFFLAYAGLTFFALIGKRASLEFSGGMQRAAESVAPISENPAMTANAPAPADVPPASAKPGSPVVLIAMAVLLVLTSATAATFATLYFTQKPTLAHVANPRDDLPADKKIAPTGDATTAALHKSKLTVFHDAVLAGQIQNAADLLKEVDIDEPDDQGRTALMKVASGGNLRMAMFLLGMGAQPNQPDKTGRTPLMYAVEKNQLGIIDTLRGDGRATTEMAAFRAQYKGLPKSGVNINVKELVLGQFTLPGLDYNARDSTGQNAYMQAFLKGHYQAAEMVARPGQADLWTDTKGNSLLHILIADGDWKTVRLTNTANMFGTWRYGDSNCYCCGHKQTNGAGQEAWMLAAEKAPLEIVKHLLPFPTLEDLQRKDVSGKTGLDLATAKQNTEVVAYLTQLPKLAEEKAKKSKDEQKK